jgi:hypothetical protein
MKYVDKQKRKTTWEASAALEYTLTSPRLEEGEHTYEVSRFGPGGIVYSRDQMLCIMLFNIAGMYKWSPGMQTMEDRIVKRDTAVDLTVPLVSALIRLAIGQNQTLISPPFRRDVGLKNDPWKCPLPGIITIYHQLDRWRFQQYLDKNPVLSMYSGKAEYKREYPTTYIYTDIVKQGKINFTLNWSEHRKPSGEVPSLVQLAYEKASHAHRAFYQTEHGPMVAYSMQNVHLKIPGMLKAFNQPTHKMNDRCKKHMYLLPAAMDRLVDILGVRKHLGKYRWKLNPALLRDEKMTSGGERADRRGRIRFKGGSVVHTAIGQKTINATYCANKLQEFFDSCLTEKPYFHHPNYKIAKKHEMHYASGEPGSISKIHQKCREFYIPHSMVIGAERALFLFKHLIHRGPVITIGMSWWWGGGQRFYEQMYVPGGLAGDGDFSKIDKTIKAVLLGLHTNAGTMFLDLKGMKPEDVRMYRVALRVMSKIKVVKVTRINGNTWVVVKGVNPSGVLETSDANSWIVALLIAMWVETMRLQSKENMKRIDKYFYSQFRVKINGDDHVMNSGPDLVSILNEHSFAWYVEQYWDMEIRDRRVGLSIKSTIQDDKLIDTGLLYLKRYVVDRPAFMPAKCSSIVPWKPASGHFMRIPYSDTGFAGWTRILVSIIGHAWDSMGTNLTAYSELSVLYNMALLESGVKESTIPKLVREEFRDDTLITKMYKKLNLSEKDFAGFPTLSELHSRHVYRELSNVMDPEIAFGSTALDFDNYTL